MTSSDPASILDLSRDELVAFCRDHSQPPYRAAQIWNWIHSRCVADWTAMKNLPHPLRAVLSDSFHLDAAVSLGIEGAPGHTRKILVGLRDGQRVEEVIIPARDRRTVCVSSQVGCRFHCAFCASGQAGFVRNLTPGEMVGQILLAARLCGHRPHNVVYMGVGEPMDNYDAVLKSIRIINDPEGLAMGARRITVSTSGIIPGIDRLAGENLQVELSVSLHAPRNDLRTRLMPLNQKYPLPDLIRACRAYSEKTGRIVTFEYNLIRGVNDARQDAQDLARLLKPLPARVNLLLLNPIPEFDGQPSPAGTAAMFLGILDRHHVNATLREPKGRLIHAACGQLRRST